MSGHNKWSTIKHKKGRADAARGKLFTKLIREIVVATKEGGDDTDGNPRLRAAVITARNANMPKDTIDRALARGAGKLDGVVYEESTYEGYGPSGCAFFIETLTDNKNRTVAEIRHALAKNGGNLGTDGSVAWMFERKGLIEIAKADVGFEAIFEAAVEAGAEDVEDGDEMYSIYTEFTDLHGVAKALEDAGHEVQNAKPTRVTDNLMELSGDDAAKTFRLMMIIDDLDDVQNIYTNADISDEEMEALSLIVLGVDPGTRLCGWGLVRADGSRLEHVDNGVLVLPRGELQHRLVALFDGLDAIIARYEPVTAGIESVFTNRNARAALTLGHGRGVALLAVARRGLSVSEYTPQQVKKAAVGSGRADKSQIQVMVAQRLGLAEPPQVDAADALAVALCHAQHEALGLPRMPSQPRGGQRRAKAGLAALVAAQQKGKS